MHTGGGWQEVQSLLNEPSFLSVLQITIQITFQSNHMLSPYIHWVPQEGRDSILMRHAQGMASMKPVRAGVDEEWVTGRG